MHLMNLRLSRNFGFPCHAAWDNGATGKPSPKHLYTYAKGIPSRSMRCGIDLTLPEFPSLLNVRSTFFAPA